MVYTLLLISATFYNDQIIGSYTKCPHRIILSLILEISSCQDFRKITIYQAVIEHEYSVPRVVHNFN